LSGSTFSNSALAKSNTPFANATDITLFRGQLKRNDGSVYVRPLTSVDAFLGLEWNTRTQRTRWPTRLGGSRKFVSLGCRFNISSTAHIRPSQNWKQ
jgi:hypothetical protein